MNYFFIMNPGSRDGRSRKRFKNIFTFLNDHNADYKYMNDAAYRFAADYERSYAVCDWLMTQDDRYQKDQSTGEYLIVENGVETFRKKEKKKEPFRPKNSPAEEQAKQDLIDVLEESKENTTDDENKESIDKIQRNVIIGLISHSNSGEKPILNIVQIKLLCGFSYCLIRAFFQQI